MVQELQPAIPELLVAQLPALAGVWGAGCVPTGAGVGPHWGLEEQGGHWGAQGGHLGAQGGHWRAQGGHWRAQGSHWGAGRPGGAPLAASWPGV